jgi:hypothetical protein
MLDLVEDSIEAYLSSIECQDLSFMRPVNSVMY